MIRRAFARAALLAAVLSAPVRAEEPLRIGEIRVQPLDVFSPEEASRGWIYRTANAVRFQTRESVVRKFLLFHEGDPFDPARLVETERNLRAQPFLKFASVTAGEPHDGVVDVDVVTQDAWTTEPGISFGGRGGETTYSFDLKEKDFLGSGRQLAISHQKTTDRTTRLFQYVDPYLFGGSYWLGDFAYALNSDGEEERIGVRRGFVSFVDRWGVNGLIDHMRSNERIFANGETFSRFRRRRTEGIGWYGWALQANDERARRVFVGFHDAEDRFAPLAGEDSPVVPDDRRFRYVTAAYQEVENRFVKLNYVNRDSRYEDFNLGRSIFLEVGVSPSAFGTSRTTERLRASAGAGWAVARGFLLARVAYETRWEGTPKNEIVSGSLLYVAKFPTARPLQTFVSRLVFDRGWSLDKDVQFFADGDTGLRAYRLHAFEGDKRVLWNAEQRFFWGREFLQLFSPGAAVFFDTGAATPAGRSLGIGDFKSDVGVGVRIAITRAASNSILRFDMAYALNPDARGRRGLLFSFSSGQVF